MNEEVTKYETSTTMIRKATRC